MIQINVGQTGDPKQLDMSIERSKIKWRGRNQNRIRRGSSPVCKKIPREEMLLCTVVRLDTTFDSRRHCAYFKHVAITHTHSSRWGKHAHTHAHTHVWACVYMQAYTHTLKHTHTLTHTHKQTSTHTHSHTHAHTQAHTRTHAFTHTRIHAHTSIGVSSRTKRPILFILEHTGMPAASHFVLWGGDGDGTLGMRNALAYDTSRALGEWAPRVQNCELFVIQVCVRVLCFVGQSLLGVDFKN